MQSETPTREQLQAHLALLGLELDEGRLEALLPVYEGVLSGARRVATLDLGESEPAMVLRWSRPEAGTQGGQP